MRPQEKIEPLSDEGALLSRALDGDQRAWRKLVGQHEPALKTLVRESYGLSETDADDVLGDFWLRLVENDDRKLRSFDRARGTSLAAWLAFQTSQVAHEHARRRAEEPATIPLDEAPQIADLQQRIDLRKRSSMMRVEEVAERWDVHPKTVYGMIERGELPAKRLGRVLRIARSVVDSFEQASVAPGGKKCR